MHNSLSRLVLVDQHVVRSEVGREDVSLHQHGRDVGQPGREILPLATLLWETL
jgi:hypothetical protein